MVVEGNDGGVFTTPCASNVQGNWSPPWNSLSRRACVCLLFATILCLVERRSPRRRRVRAAPGRDDARRHYLRRQLPRPQQGRHDRQARERQEASARSSPPTRTSGTIREWPHGTTGDWRLNSSSAVVSLPSGSRVIHAELIWGGSYLFGSEDVSDFLNDPINFTTPAGTTQVTRDPTTAVDAIRSPAELLRSHSERHGPRQRGGQRHLHGWSRSRDAGHGRSELQRRRLDAGHSLRKRRPAYPQPLAVPRPRTAGRRNRLGLGHLHAGQQRTSCGRAWP